MEGLHSNNNSRLSKLKDFNSNVSPINTLRDNNQQLFIGGCHFLHSSKSSTFDAYAASVDKCNLENLDPSTLIRYLRSGSPSSPDEIDAFKTPAVMIGHQYLSSNSNSSGGTGGFGSRGLSPLTSVENFGTPPSRSPPLFNTPEDVLVMDGILVGGSVSGGRMRLSSSSDSGPSSSGSNSFHKREICRSWEDSNHCRHGSKCQFAHGKEEIRPSRLPNKNKVEICKSYSGLGSCSYGANCRFAHHQVITVPPPTGRSSAKVSQTKSISPIRPENSNDSNNSTNSSSSKTTAAATIIVTNIDWFPMDDGIMASLPCSASVDEIPSREAVDAYMNSVLHGPSRERRLPVFAEFCLE